MPLAIGINMEYVRHGDKPFDYGIRKAAELGFEYVEPNLLNGRDLMAEAGYYHFVSMDDDPLEHKAFDGALQRDDSLRTPIHWRDAITASERRFGVIRTLYDTKSAARMAADLSLPEGGSPARNQPQILRFSALSRLSFVVQSPSRQSSSHLGEATMRRFFALLKTVCGKLLEGFVRTRLMAELPSADELIRRQIDHPSDDPRSGSGLPMVGVL